MKKARVTPDVEANRTIETMENIFLPNELWDKIFKYSDYPDLLNLTKVSERFKDIAVRVLDTKYAWYRKCRRQVPERHWCSILENMEHPDGLNCEDFHTQRNCMEIWKFLYSSWIEWKKIFNKEPEIVKVALEPVYGPNNTLRTIDEFAIYGNIIAVYVINHGIRFFDVSRESLEPSHEILYPYYCEAIELRKQGNDLIAVAVGHEPTGKFLVSWNVQSQKLISSVDIGSAEDVFIITSFGYSCMIKTYHRRGRHCKVEIRKVDSKENPKHVRFRMESDQRLLDIQTYGDNLMLLAPKVSKNLVALYTISLREAELKEIYITSKDTHGDGIYRIFQPCVVAYMDWDTIGFSVSGRRWKFYNTKKDLDVETPLAYWGATYEVGILVLMLQTGDIQMLSVDDPDCLDGKLPAVPSKMVKLDWRHWNGSARNEFSVVGMSFTEHNMKKYLVIVAEKEISVLKF